MMGENGTRYVFSRCDEPMARSCGILGKCGHRCATCLAALLKDELGQEKHNSLGRGSDPNLAENNIMILSGFKRGGHNE